MDLHMEKLEGTLREQVRLIIFGTETREGRLFDVVLLWCIGLSVAAVVLESVDSITMNGPV